MTFLILFAAFTFVAIVCYTVGLIQGIKIGKKKRIPENAWLEYQRTLVVDPEARFKNQYCLNPPAEEISDIIKGDIYIDDDV